MCNIDKSPQELLEHALKQLDGMTVFDLVSLYRECGYRDEIIPKTEFIFVEYLTYSTKININTITYYVYRGNKSASSFIKKFKRWSRNYRKVTGSNTFKNNLCIYFLPGLDNDEYKSFKTRQLEFLKNE